MKALVCLLLALVLPWLPRAASADPSAFEAEQQAAVAANPPGITLTLLLPEGRAQFHPGEVIPLTAIFASSKPGAYKLNTDAGSRDLQWGGDAFHVEPQAGVTDPLPLVYEGKNFVSYNGPGPQFQNLERQPISIPFVLNEWMRFDVPGRYRVYLTSGRITRHQGRGFDLLFFQGRMTSSTAIDLEILPDDPEWSARTLRQALPLFNSASEDYQTNDPRLAATRTVRFLGTPEAARAMIARYGRLTEYDSWNSQSYFQTRLGLFGSPQRALILREMGQKIADPQFPIFPFFVNDLSQLELYDAFTVPLPPYPSQNAAKAKAWEAQNQAQNAALTALISRNLKDLAGAIAAKRGRARAVRLYSLFSLVANETVSAAPQSLIKPLIASFDQLTPAEQSDLLDNHWPAFRSSPIMPALRRLYGHPPAKETYTATDMSSLALRRLRELAPAEGRVRLMAEIQSVHPRVDLKTLCSLSDRTLPTLDKTLAAHLETAEADDGLEVESGLVQRYATRAILPRVKVVYRDRDVRSNCDVQTKLLAYFLRTERGYGVAQVRKVLADRKETGCYHSVLSDVAALYTCSQLERLAVEYLHDPDVEVAADAAQTLGTYGSPAAEAALWQRLREWHRQWQGKASAVEPTEKNLAPVQGQLEWRLCGALALSPMWLVDRTKLQSLQSLCVTGNERNNVHNYLQSWTSPLRISYGGNEDAWSVVQYDQLSSLAALEAKLAQFPSGTRFLLDPVNFRDARQQEAAFQQLRPFLKRHGLLLSKENFPIH